MNISLIKINYKHQGAAYWISASVNVQINGENQTIKTSSLGTYNDDDNDLQTQGEINEFEIEALRDLTNLLIDLGFSEEYINKRIDECVY